MNQPHCDREKISEVLSRFYCNYLVQPNIELRLLLIVSGYYYKEFFMVLCKQKQIYTLSTHHYLLYLNFNTTKKCDKILENVKRLRRSQQLLLNSVSR